MEQGGNSVVNRVFGANLRGSAPAGLSATSEMSERNNFCRKKYIERKYYQSAEYLKILKAINRSASTSNGTARNPSAMPRVKPFSKNMRKGSKITETKEKISDADFFKSMSEDDDWLKPFEKMEYQQINFSHRRRKDKKNGDELSHSWHPESPCKALQPRPSGVASNKTLDYRSNTCTTMSMKPKQGAGLFVKRKQLSFPEEDETIMDSICKTDATSVTVTNTTRRSQGKRTDILAASCHASISTRNQARLRDLSTNRHKKAHPQILGENHQFAGSSDPSINVHNNPPPTNPIANISSVRPRLQRRSSTTDLLRNNEGKDRTPQPTRETSELVVAALLDFIQATTDVTEEEIDMIMRSTHKDGARSMDKRKDSRRGHEGLKAGDVPIQGENAGRLQKSESFARRKGGGQRSRSSSRSASRSRANSRSRRVVLARKNSISDKLKDGDQKRSRSPKKPRPQSPDRKIRAYKQGGIERNDNAQSHIITDEVVRSTSFENNRRNRENPRSRSGTDVGRSKRIGGEQAGHSRETLSRSRSGGRVGRSKQNESGHGAPRRTGSLSGRQRPESSHGEGCRNAPTSKRQLKSHQDPDSSSHRSIEADGDKKLERRASCSSFSDSPTVSEASDIVDDDDLLIL
jgi:hypothetical protein